MDRNYWDSYVETMSRGELEQLQLERLNKTLARAGSSAFYKGRLPDSVSSLDQLKEIGFTTKPDLRNSYPCGMTTAPMEDMIRMHSSSGTTGSTTVIYHTRGDIDNWTELVARSMHMTGVRKSDVFQNMMGYGLFTGGLGLHYGSERLGCLTIPASSGNSRRQIRLMMDFGTTVIHITPSYALHLYSIIEHQGLHPREDLKLRIAFLGAEPYSDETRKKIEQLYGVDAFNSYGLSEMNGPGVAFECTAKQGMHVWEDSYILEVVDPKTGECVEDGREGEVVLTTLMREGMPLIRYRTGDIASVYTGECPCGRTHRRISRIKGRSDDMLIIKGVNLYPLQIEKVLMNIPQVGNNYLIEIDKTDYLDTLNIKVEVGPQIFHGEIGELEALKNRITQDLKNEILIAPRVVLVEPNSLPASEGKAVRVIDKRNKTS
ncbi:MAG: phenylacetate--CoA ligase family protein [Spirochaetota bacterium]